MSRILAYLIAGDHGIGAGSWLVPTLDEIPILGSSHQQPATSPSKAPEKPQDGRNHRGEG